MLRQITTLALAFFLVIPAAAQAPDNAAEAPGDKAVQRIALIRFGTPESPLEISPFSEAFFNRKYEAAKRMNADVLIVEIDSPGGYVDSSINMALTLRNTDWATTVAYVPRQALSGAAIMSLGCDQIIMKRNAFIGDAGPIFMGDDFMFRHAPEKIRSDLVSKVRTLSENGGRPPAIAEAMVDMDLEVFKVTHADSGEVSYMSNAELKALEDPTEWRKGPLLEASKKGQFLEVNGQQAVDIGLADDVASSRSALAARFDKQNKDIILLEPTWVDTLVTILNFRFVTVLLFIAGLIAVYVELAAPGIGVGGITAALCFGLFFWSRFLGGTAGWLEVTLFLGGIAFLLMEFFVIPGFGIAGIAGIAMMIVSLLMASTRWAGTDGVSVTDFSRSLLVLCGSAAGSIVGMYLVARYVGGLKLFRNLTLEPPEHVTAPAANSLAATTGQPNEVPIAAGDEGIADSALKPSGRVLFGDVYRDVVTDGSFVDKGKRVRVIKVTGPHITVREV